MSKNGTATTWERSGNAAAHAHRTRRGLPRERRGGKVGAATALEARRGAHGDEDEEEL